MRRRYKQFYNTYQCAQCSLWHVGRPPRYFKSGLGPYDELSLIEVGERATVHLYQKKTLKDILKLLWTAEEKRRKLQQQEQGSTIAPRKGRFLP